MITAVTDDNLVSNNEEYDDEQSELDDNEEYDEEDELDDDEEDDEIDGEDDHDGDAEEFKTEIKCSLDEIGPPRKFATSFNTPLLSRSEWKGWGRNALQADAASINLSAKWNDDNQTAAKVFSDVVDVFGWKPTIKDHTGCLSEIATDIVEKIIDMDTTKANPDRDFFMRWLTKSDSFTSLLQNHGSTVTDQFMPLVQANHSLTMATRESKTLETMPRIVDEVAYYNNGSTLVQGLPDGIGRNATVQFTKTTTKYDKQMRVYKANQAEARVLNQYLTQAADLTQAAEARARLSQGAEMLSMMSTISEDENFTTPDESPTEPVPAESDDDDLESNEERAKFMSEINRALKGIGPPGDFSTGGRFNPPPHLSWSVDIDGLGRIALPLCPQQAEALKLVCEPAPYGKGRETLFDTNVRNALQADAQLVHTSAKWNEAVQKLVSETVIQALGIAGKVVEARLYKLVLYETGGFFLRHQDTEKEGGMFGTLVVQLPSLFTGGELVTDHGRATKRFDHQKDSQSEFFYTAFFADVYHELKPVTSGWRLCLVYNLVQTSNGPLPTPTNFGPVVQQLNPAMRQWIKHKTPPKLIIQLEHKYTEANLSFTKLKGRDQSIVEALKLLKDSNEPLQQLLKFYLIRFDRTVSGSATYEHRSWKRSRCYYDSGDDDDDGRYAEMEEVHETENYTFCINEKNQRVTNFDQSHFDLETECIDENLNSFEQLYDSSKADEREYEGYMGNSGPTLTFTYHHTFLIITPRQWKYSMVPSSKIVAYLVAKMNEKSNNVVTAVIKESFNRIVADSHLDIKAKFRLLECCGSLKDLQKSLKVLKSCETQLSFGGADDYSAKVLVDLIGIFGWPAVGPIIKNIIILNVEDEFKFCSSFLQKMPKELIAEVVNAVINEVVRLDNAARNAPVQPQRPMFNRFPSIPQAPDRTYLANFVQAHSFTTLLRDYTSELSEKLMALVNRRVGQIPTVKPVLSWSLPNAIYSGNPNVEAFLKGPLQSIVFNGFGGVQEARVQGNKIVDDIRRMNNGVTLVEMSASGVGKKATLQLKKSRTAYDRAMQVYEANMAELKFLNALLAERARVLAGPSNTVAEVKPSADVIVLD
ncbi:hypothetical protein HDU76_001200 [Blyttiomyces sp. JEL0837]|nr:hypothetical protein HDU76_001200 [Blyttiomyces sp. JEL0837]